jgi:hypothetical protein
MNPDLKVYNTDVYLEGNIPSLRTGMSCKVDIIVEQYDDAVYVPVQTVLRVGGESTVFVVKDGSIEERKVKVGLDNRRMIRIISGLDEGEVVSLTPPLKSAAVEPGSEMTGTGLSGSGDDLKRRVNEKLEETNGTEDRRPVDMPSEGVEGPQRESGPGDIGAGQTKPGREGLESLTPEQREQMRKRFENMTPEEREKTRQRFQGTGTRRGGGSRQGGGQRPQGSGRD